MRDDPLRHRCCFKSLTPKERFARYTYPCPMSGCWIWMGAQSGDGYGLFQLDQKPVGAHRQAWIWAGKGLPAGAQVCHHCDNPLCVNPAHMFIGSAQDNSDDKVRKRRHMFGVQHPGAKLTEQEVIALRAEALAPKANVSAIARKYGVGRAQVGRIARGLRWAHV